MKKINETMHKDAKNSSRASPAEQNASTDGIEISNFCFPYIGSETAQQPHLHNQMVNVSVWDFGGQEIYYPTHQLFLGDRSVYLIVFNLLDANSEARIYFWLQSIKSRASKFSIIIAATHAEDPRVGSPEDVKQRLAELKKKGRQILRNFNSLSVLPIAPTVSAGFMGIDQLRTEIERVICKQRHILQKLQNSYFIFEKLILEYRQKLAVPIVSFSDIKVLAILAQLETPEMSRELGESEASEASVTSDTSTKTEEAPTHVLEQGQQEVDKPALEHDAIDSVKSLCENSKTSNKVLRAALTLLHDLGTILFFGGDTHLNDKIVVDPQWLANLMASLFTTKHSWVSTNERAKGVTLR